MNVFDSTIIHFVNGFAQTSKPFDSAMSLIVDNNLFKGGVVVSILWFFWFHNSPKIINNREVVIIALISCLIGIFIARALATSLPFRERPALNTALNFVKPFGIGELGQESGSSFPSDHGVLFFSLATGIFLISKRLGILTFLYVAIFICFPRIYMGYHHPTDIIAGALIGIFITIIVSANKFRQPLTKNILNFSNKYPGIFYVLFFLLTFQICTLFFASREIGNYFFQLLHNSFKI